MIEPEKRKALTYLTLDDTARDVLWLDDAEAQHDEEAKRMYLYITGREFVQAKKRKI